MFGSIRAPRLERELLISLDGQRVRVPVSVPLLLVVHDGPVPDVSAAKGASAKRVDWTFTVWNPESYHHLFSDPKTSFYADHAHFRQPVPPPRIDVYLGNDGPLRWEEIRVPGNVHVIDLRLRSTGADTENGGVLRGTVFDMATHQPIGGTTVSLVERTASRAWKQTTSTATGSDGRFELSRLPKGIYGVQMKAAGCASRNAGTFDNRSGHASMDFDVLLSKDASLQGIVVSDRGEPLSGVSVTPVNVMGIDGLGYLPTEEMSVTSDAHGAFELASLPDGYAGLRCTSTSLYQQTSHAQLYRVSARPYEKVPDVRICMVGTGKIRGKVISRNGQPPAREFNVNLEPQGGSRVGAWSGSMNCGEGGTFAFEGIPPGEYILVARPNPGRDDEASPPKVLTVTAGSDQDVQIQNE